MNIKDCYADIRDEELSLKADFGEQTHSPEVWLAIIGGAFGGLCDSLVVKDDIEEYRRKLAVLAAWCAIAMEDTKEEHIDG